MYIYGTRKYIYMHNWASAGIHIALEARAMYPGVLVLSSRGHDPRVHCE